MYLSFTTPMPIASAVRSQLFNKATVLVMLASVPSRHTLRRRPRKSVSSSKLCSPEPRLTPTAVFISSSRRGPSSGVGTSNRRFARADRMPSES